MIITTIVESDGGQDRFKGMFGLLPMLTLPKYWSACEIWQSFGLVPNNWLAQLTYGAPVLFSPICGRV
jgi:hypothetical protein